MPRFSVLIPVRYRPFMARLAVLSALAENEDLEVVVADNCDEKLDLGIEDARLRLVRSERVLSMPENWERALRAARGEWTLLLSDKCRVVPGALARFAALAGNRHDVVTYSRALFVQSLTGEAGKEEGYLERSPGLLKIVSLKPFSVVGRDSSDALRSWYEHPVYANPSQPMLYNSFVRRNVVERMLARAPVFLGMAPDVASSLAILSSTAGYLETTIPGTIVHFPNSRVRDWSNGFALGSGGALGARFLEEFGSDPLDSYGLPLCSASVVMQTLLAFRDARREALPAHVRVAWSEFSDFAAAEIEGFESNRVRAHVQLAVACQREGLSGRSLIHQVKRIAAFRSHRLLEAAVRRFPRLHALYRRARGLPPAQQPSGEGWPYGGVAVQSLKDALQLAAAEGECFEHHGPGRSEKAAMAC